jgi:hypothetical protein
MTATDAPPSGETAPIGTYPASWALAKVVLKETRGNAKYYAGQLGGIKIIVPMVGRMRRTRAADAMVGETRSVIPGRILGNRQGVAVVACGDDGEAR